MSRRAYTVIGKTVVGRVRHEENGVDEVGNVPDSVLIESAKAYAIASGELTDIEADFLTWSLVERPLTPE